MSLTQKPVRELFGFSSIDRYSFVVSLKGDSQETLSKLEKAKEQFDKEFTEFYGQRLHHQDLANLNRANL